MRVEMLKLRAGPGVLSKPGDVIVVSREEGAALLAGRYARLVAGEKQSPPEIETASVTAPETAVKRGPGRPRVVR